MEPVGERRDSGRLRRSSRQAADPQFNRHSLVAPAEVSETAGTMEAWRPPPLHTLGHSLRMILSFARCSSRASSSCAMNSSPRALMAQSIYSSFSAALILGLSDRPSSPRLPARQRRRQRVAANRDLLVAYLELLKLRLTGALLIPIPVLTEVRSGQRGSDALVDRLIKAIGAEDDVYAPLTAHHCTSRCSTCRGIATLAPQHLDNRRANRRDGRGTQLYVRGNDRHRRPR